LGNNHQVNKTNQECFLTGTNPTNSLIHQIGVYDPLTSELETIYISDYAYKTICLSDDDEVATLWSAWKQAYSAGYTDASFLRQLEIDSENYNMKLYLIVEGQKLSLLLEAPLDVIAGGYSFVCKTVRPLNKKSLIESAIRLLPKLEVKDSTWIDDRYALYDGKAITGLPWTNGLFNMASIKYGSPPDLFSVIAQNQTLAGFELIRRLAL
jgi:hypothetical protein